MNLPMEIFGDVLVVHAPDELTEEHAGRFQQFLMGQERVKMVVDLDSVEAIDSSGLTCLLNVQDDLRAARGDLKLIVGKTANRKILEITRLDQSLEMFDSVIEAVKSFV